MRSKITSLMILLAVATFTACGGTSSDQSSAINLKMALLQVEEGDPLILETEGGDPVIQGTVFNDLNGDGFLNTAEPGIPGVAVDLSGWLTSSTVTDSTGMYSFAVSLGQDYTVSVLAADSLLATTSTSATRLNVQESQTVNFGFWDGIATYAIYGFVYEDWDENKTQDTGEPGIFGVNVTLAYADTTATTDGDGFYSFVGLEAGPYTVVETNPEGTISTTDDEQQVDIIDMHMQVDFGDLYVQEIPVDIKPGSDINPLNLRSRGVLPVAIIGTDEVDVTLIDPASLRLNDLAPLRWSYEDVCGSEDFDTYGDDCVGPDGTLDMTVKFSTEEIAESLGDGLVRGNVVTLVMRGLLTTVDALPLYGEETVWIVQVPK